MLYPFALCLILYGIFGAVQNDEYKRPLFDIESEILKLKRQFNIQASEIKAHVSEIKAQASEIDSLKQQLYAYEHSGEAQKTKQIKRLLLHSDTDIATEILDLKSQFNAQAYEIKNLKQQLNAYEHSGKGLGSSYVRWGRTVCPGNGSSLLYKGFMSGTFIPGHLQSGKGSGANFLCLPENPLWDYYTDTKENDILITGVEYNFSPYNTAEQIKFFGNAPGHSEAPCVTCHINRGSNIMIPGRTECFGGWTKEYSGYLVAGYPGYADSSEYVCLDRRPEVVAHSGNAVYENNLYFVESHCGGTLACPPYVDGRELSCVVCSI